MRAASLSISFIRTSHKSIFQHTVNKSPVSKSLIFNQSRTMATPTPDEIRTAAEQPGAVILDVRTKDEIDKAPFTKKPYKHATCSLDDTSELLEKADELLPDKNAPVIIFCRSGRRAGKAKELLEERGYKTVLNAGGLGDIDAVF